jgi:hypothetical protein
MRGYSHAREAYLVGNPRLGCGMRRSPYIQVFSITKAHLRTLTEDGRVIIGQQLLQGVWPVHAEHVLIKGEEMRWHVKRLGTRGHSSCAQDALEDLAHLWISGDPEALLSSGGCAPALVPQPAGSCSS